VKKGIGNVVEDFSRSEVFLFLETDRDRWAVQCEDKGQGLILAELPNNMAEGVYHVELIWYKGEDALRSIQRTKKECVFAIDKNVEHKGNKCVVRIESIASPYGYDGLSAYELAVIGGYTSDMTQNEWSRILYGYQESEANRIVAENTREQNEADRQDNENTRMANEAERESMESMRMEAEQAREQNEAIRLENESSRHASERDRKVNEGARRANEDTRIANEAERESMESLRMEAEQAREQNEAIRQAQEEARQARVVQKPGGDKSLVMSQKAVTDEITRITDEIADEFTRVDKNHGDLDYAINKKINNLASEAQAQTARLDNAIKSVEESTISEFATIRTDLYPHTITEAQKEAMEQAGTWNDFTKSHPLIYVYEDDNAQRQSN
jgi:hypothetical protein